MKCHEGGEPVGAQRRDPQASPVQGVVREDFQEEVDSELHPEGRLGMRGGRRRKAEQSERAEGTRAQRLCAVWHGGQTVVPMLACLLCWCSHVQALP